MKWLKALFQKNRSKVGLAASQTDFRDTRPPTRNTTRITLQSLGLNSDEEIEEYILDRIQKGDRVPDSAINDILASQQEKQSKKQN
jgi:hypothetical protein